MNLLLAITVIFKHLLINIIKIKIAIIKKLIMLTLKSIGMPN